MSGYYGRDPYVPPPPSTGSSRSSSKRSSGKIRSKTSGSQREMYPRSQKSRPLPMMGPGGSARGLPPGPGSGRNPRVGNTQSAPGHFQPGSPGGGGGPPGSNGYAHSLPRQYQDVFGGPSGGSAGGPPSSSGGGSLRGPGMYHHHHPHHQHPGGGGGSSRSNYGHAPPSASPQPSPALYGKTSQTGHVPPPPSSEPMVPKRDYDNIKTSYDNLTALVASQKETIDKLKRDLEDAKQSKLQMLQKIMKLQSSAKKESFGDRKPPDRFVSSKLPRSNTNLDLSIHDRHAGKRPKDYFDDGDTVSDVSEVPTIPGFSQMNLMEPGAASQQERPVDFKKALSKYKAMERSGTKFDQVIKIMRMEGCHPDLLAAYRRGDGEDDDDDAVQDPSTGRKSNANMVSPGAAKAEVAAAKQTAATDPRFAKYNKMKKIGMPMQSILNKMRMDQMSKEDIAIFEGKPLNAGRGRGLSTMGNRGPVDRNAEHLEICKKYGLAPPKPNVRPRRVKKLKKIHWEVIDPVKIKRSIWDSINKDKTQIRLGPKFELNFQVRQRKPRVIGKKIQERQEAGRGKSKKKILFVDAKKDKSIQIAMRRLRMSNEEIYDAIVNMNDDKLNQDALATLADLLPTSEEAAMTETKADECGDDCELFGFSEMFWLELTAIPEVRKQVELWLFSLNFAQLYDDRSYQVNTIMSGLRAIQQSRGLRRYLQICLRMGNFMNHDTTKQQAFGFNLNNLVMMDSIKDYGGKKTMIMHVYEHGYNEPTLNRETQAIFKELEILKAASRIDSMQVEKSIREMDLKFNEIERFIQTLREDFYEGDSINFCDYMNYFLDDKMKQMMNLKGKIKNCITYSAKVSKYFAYELEDGKPENLFNVMHNFVSSLDKSKHQLIKLEKDRQKAMEKRKRQNAKKKMKKSQSKMTLSERLERKQQEKFEEEDDSRLKNDLVSAASAFRSRQDHLKGRLDTRFKEQQSLAQGKIPQSIESNPIKRRASQFQDIPGRTGRPGRVPPRSRFGSKTKKLPEINLKSKNKRVLKPLHGKDEDSDTEY